MARILLGVTGGIAAYKAAQIVRILRSRGHSVRCAVSRAATQFVTPLSLEVLSGEPVYEEQYLSANGSGEELHIALSLWADVVCIAPATTHCLVRLAHGLADDFLTTTMLAYGGPLVVAPAMHSEMWSKPTTQASVEVLRARGVLVIGPDRGLLANGDVGLGRMSSPEAIGAAVELASSSYDYRGVRVVITAGPTYEALDPVRFLGNRSSGRMGFALATAAALRGASVDLIAGPVGLATPPMVRRHDVKTALEMQRVLAGMKPRTEVANPEERGPEVGASRDTVLGAVDLVIMCAAVADYRPRQQAEQKIKRANQPSLTLDLVANPDLLRELAETMPAAVRVGFAAETENLESYAARKLAGKSAHFLCANDVSRPDIGFEANHNQLVVFGEGGSRIELKKAPKETIAGELLDLFLPRILARDTRDDHTS